MKIEIIETDKIETSRPILFKDLKKGDVFQFCNVDAFSWGSCDWDDGLYLMINPKLISNGQVVNIGTSTLGWLDPKSRTKYRVFNKMTMSLITDRIVGESC